MTHDLLQPERQGRIKMMLAEQGKVLAADLAALFAVSEDTIRRDLREMAARGDCARVYGGALALSGRTEPMVVRMGVMPERKAALAKAAANLVKPGMTLFIDAGSTNLAIARCLPDMSGLTVVTNAPDIALALAEHDDTTIVLVGGEFDRHTRAVLGSRAISQLAGFNPDLAILGVCGLSETQGLTAISCADGDIKRQMASQARGVLLAATNDKFGLVNPWPVCAAERIAHLVVEHDAPAELLAAFAAHGAAIIHAARPPARPSSSRGAPDQITTTSDRKTA